MARGSTKYPASIYLLRVEWIPAIRASYTSYQSLSYGHSSGMSLKTNQERKELKKKTKSYIEGFIRGICPC